MGNNSIKNYNEVLGWQDGIIETSKKMTKKEIIEKVEQIEEERYHIHRCLNAKVCPGCGRNLSDHEATSNSFSCYCGFVR